MYFSVLICKLCTISEQNVFLKGSMAQRGDVIGCRLLFGKRGEHGGVPVVFSLNGNDLKLDGDQIEILGHSDNDWPAFPFICMGYQGISVLFKVRVYWPAFPFICMGYEGISVLFKVRVYWPAFPFICMGYEGISVLFKVRVYWPAFPFICMGYDGISVLFKVRVY